LKRTGKLLLPSVSGTFNIYTTGKHFYIDDLSTLPESRGKGYGGMLLDHVIELAKKKDMHA
jgi:ribosomal protein S18 acetylase RimI-like enzyme